MPETDTPDFDGLLAAVDALLAEETDRDTILQAVCDLLRDRVAHYDWVGFYLTEPGGEALVLGPFAGQPTEHVRIAFGEGICGQAAARKETFLVPDVTKETNYLSCDIKVMSEIVVPIPLGEDVRAELDIDSHTVDAFTPADQAFLETVCKRLRARF